MKRRGELAIVLHTHMPYVEGFGTWPFGEEWLWEAIATSYLPLLDVLARAPITLSVTPVLCDQLEAPGATERCLTFLEEIRPESHRRDIEGIPRRRAGAAGRGARALGGGVRRRGASGSTSSTAGLAAAVRQARRAGRRRRPTRCCRCLRATAAIGLQVQTGIASHRRRFGTWAGGFWLPECAYAPWLDPLLEDAGVRATCVELTTASGSAT